MRRRVNEVALVGAVGLHAALALVWALQRPEPPLWPMAPTIQVQLTRAPPLSPLESVQDAVSPPTPAHSVRARPATAAARPSPPLISATAPAPAPASAPLADAAGSAQDAPPVSPALARALSQRLTCADVGRLSQEERARCEQRFAATAYVDLPERNPLALQAEHRTLMAGVRRAENGTRASCEQMRNLDPTCPNMLPDNLGEDEVPVPGRSKRRVTRAE